MVSLYDSFAMFPTAHHHHHHPGVGVAGGAGHPAGHSILTRHGHPAVGAPQLNLHHQHHQTGVNQAYFGYSAHPAAHHYGQSPSHQYPHSNMMGNAAAAELHPQQFGTVGGLVASDGASWHTPTVYSGLSGVSPRTPAASGYEDWASSPNSSANNNNGNNGATAAPNVVSSPDGSPSVHPHYQQSVSPVDGYSGSYGKLFVSTGGHSTEFAPHGTHLNQPVNSGQDIVSITPIPHGRMTGNCNAVGPSSSGSNVTSAVVGAGHHSPDSGLAGSDGLSSAGSPAQHQHPGILGQTNNPLMNSMNNGGSGAGVQPGQASANGSNSANLNMNNMNISRPQPSRSPFEWMKKPNYTHQSNPNGKTRTKDKYRVVYTDHQRLELEKEFHYSRYITIRRKSELASVLGLSERQVKIWFQNRRAKERKQVKKREEMLHKEKLDVVTSHPAHPSAHLVGLHAQQQQQQQQQQHQAAMNVVVQQQQQQQVSSVALGNHAHLAQMVDTKPVLGLIE